MVIQNFAICRPKISNNTKILPNSLVSAKIDTKGGICAIIKKKQKSENSWGEKIQKKSCCPPDFIPGRCSDGHSVRWMPDHGTWTPPSKTAGHCCRICLTASWTFSSCSLWQQTGAVGSPPMGQAMPRGGGSKMPTLTSHQATILTRRPKRHSISTSLKEALKEKD